uniref:Male-specific lethal 3-like n=1 Tax=Phallusia mammillata TaxID=59560 RepID=A0A6F9DKR2_9ASCI|nr:male-specific lethal 3-like [Phallusia mammillata]
MKPKFAVGERVLCFEPDRSKARVLYDAKILDVDFVRDGKSKKEPEYKVHFQGWNSAWDRWADETYVLKNNEENKKLQRKLARRAIRQLKVHGRKKVHLPGVASVLKNPPLDDESSDSDCSINSDQMRTLLPDDMVESDSSCQSPQIKRRRRRSTATSKKSDDTPGCSNETFFPDVTTMQSAPPTPVMFTRKPLQIDIPYSLLQRLQDDAIMVKNRNMLVELPAKLNIVQILENYVKYFALNIAYLPSSEKHLKVSQTSMETPPPDKNLNLCKETCEDIRIVFDFMLPIILLYYCERNQCKDLAAKAVIESKPCKQEEPRKPVVETTPLKGGSIKDNNTAFNVEQPVIKAPVAEPQPITTSNKKKKLSPLAKGKPRKKTAEEQIIEETHMYLIPDQPKLDRTGLANDSQGRRRSSRLSHHLYSPENSHDEMVISPPMSPESNTTETETAAVDRTSHNLVQDKPQNDVAISVETVVFLRPPTNHKHGVHIQDHGSNSPLPLLCRQKDRYSCTSDKITPTEMCQEAYVGSAGDDVKRAVQLSQVWKWKLVSQDYRPSDGANVPCSMIYGIHHFLRLFVKLPDIFARMNIPDHKMKVIIKHLHQMLKFIAEYEREIFSYSGAYVKSATT